MNIGLFGGSFDPVHHGHLLLAELTREKNKLDRVIFIPTGIPPHKPGAKAAAQDRLAMLRLATRGHDSFVISDWETRQKRPVYSVETVAHFHHLWPKARLHFLAGSDALKTVSRWRQSTRLKKMCRFVGIPRIPALSSTEIRRRVSRRQSIRYQVPLSVERYIRKRRLYR